MGYRSYILGAVCALALGTAAAAAPLFSFTATVDGITTSRAFTGAESALRALESGDLQNQFSGYTDASAVDATLNYRGLPMQFSFPDASNTLHLVIPDLGIDQTFTGASRDAAINQMVDYMQQGTGTLSLVQKSLAARSPVEPLAGNPGSLMSLMVNEAFADDAFDERMIVGKGYSTGTDARLRPDASKSFGLNRTLFDANGIKGTTWTAPFNLTLKPSSTTVVKFNLPLRITDVDGATTLSGAARMAVQVRVKPHWLLTPSIGWGATVSTDMGSVGHVVNAALTSRYEVPMGGNYRLVLGNMVGYAKTLGMTVGDYDFDPHLSNPYTKNGVQLESRTLRAFGYSATGRVSYALTNFFGDDLYLDSVHEFGLGFGGGGDGDLPVSVEAKQTYGNDYSASSVGVNLRF